MDAQVLLERVMILIPVLLSLSVHEWAHAFSANLLGDQTARMQGRLTLNPAAHIDPIGTLLLPLLGIPFGWAKPVPVNPTQFRREVHMGTGMAITAGAGPASNLVLALLCTVIYGLIYRFAPELLMGKSAAAALLITGIQVNVGLALFNLLPIPPLDGSRILERLVPYRFRGAWDGFVALSPILLIGAIWASSTLLDGPRRFTHQVLSEVLRVVAGV